MSSDLSLMAKEIVRSFAKILFSSFRIYFVAVDEIARALIPNYRRGRLFTELLEGEFPKGGDLDERIKKIDVARDNLRDAIHAIDELRSQADENKRELADAIDRIQKAEIEKQQIGTQLETLKKVAEADTNAFRNIVGLPTRGDVWRERLLGFGSGILASVIASAIFIFLQKLF